jgi:hypothetical protein
VEEKIKLLNENLVLRTLEWGCLMLGGLLIFWMIFSFENFIYKFREIVKDFYQKIILFCFSL